VSNQGGGQIEAVATAIRQERERCAAIARAESHYWGQVEDERLLEISIGGMGAAANICGAILMGRSVDEHRGSK